MFSAPPAHSLAKPRLRRIVFEPCCVLVLATDEWVRVGVSISHLCVDVIIIPHGKNLSKEICFWLNFRSFNTPWLGKHVGICGGRSVWQRTLTWWLWIRKQRGGGREAKGLVQSACLPLLLSLLLPFLKLNLFYFMCMDVFLICMSLHHIHACPHGCHKRVPGLL